MRALCAKSLVVATAVAMSACAHSQPPAYQQVGRFVELDDDARARWYRAALFLARELEIVPARAERNRLVETKPLVVRCFGWRTAYAVTFVIKQHSVWLQLRCRTRKSNWRTRKGTIIYAKWRRCTPRLARASVASLELSVWLDFIELLAERGVGTHEASNAMCSSEPWSSYPRCRARR